MALFSADNEGLLFPIVLEKGLLADWANQPFERRSERRRAYHPLGSPRSATGRSMRHKNARRRASPLTRPRLMRGYGLWFGFSRVGVVLFGFFLALLGLLAFGFLFLRVGVVRCFFPFFFFRVCVLSRRSPGGHDGQGAASQERSRRAQKRPPREFPLGYDLIVREGPRRFWIDYLSVSVS